MKVVGAFETKNKLGHLLDLVEQGEEVTITRRGKDVARVVPARSRPGPERAGAAIQRIRERAEAAKLGRFDWAEWKAYRDEGRPLPLATLDRDMQRAGDQLGLRVLGAD